MIIQIKSTFSKIFLNFLNKERWNLQWPEFSVFIVKIYIYIMIANHLAITI